MKINYLLTASSVGLAAMMVATPAFAQSTGSVEFEEESAIVVTGSRVGDVGGVRIPSTPKAKQEISEELIRRQRPGQTVNDIVNLVPGVSFQNNDPWGSSGGTFTIRGFSSDRISQTVDGIPLNDSGNYAIYSNQQQDPETLSSVNVNLGSTDVDSPTASAVGGTLNIRTKEPEDNFKITASMAVGDVFGEGKPDSRLYMRGFAMIDTGDFTGMGTKAFVAGSYTYYDNPFNNYGKVEKKQVNGRIWQDIGDNGDFVAIAGHYNENRNNFFGSFTLPQFPTTREARFYNVGAPAAANFPCQTDAPQAGVADASNTCGTEFDRRYNPSNTGNVRGASRFTLADGLLLSVDASYQYVKANGGGSVNGFEYGYDTISGGGRANCSSNPANSATVNCQFGYFGGSPYAGVDLNGDGDLLDQVRVLAPSNTRTRRYGAIANLSYEITPDHSLRLSYTHDYANHRQTGEVIRLLRNGEPEDVFSQNAPIVDRNGNVLQKRDRQSIAILDQVSAEYRGEFGNLTAVLGVRAPFFTRDLTQNCFTTTGNASQAFVDCAYGSAAAAYQANNPYVINPTTGRPSGAALPQNRVYKYDEILPNVGFIYEFGDASIAANYAKGLSVPGTDPLYASLFFPADEPNTQPIPETTDSFDLSLRYQTGRIQAQLAGWYTRYQNRLASFYDPELDQSVFRNLGVVDKYGLDASVAYSPSSALTFYVFGSILESEIKDNLQGGNCTTAQGNSGAYGCTVATVGQPYNILTGGKRESGSPIFTVGGRAEANVGDFTFGAQVKHTGKRYLNDENLPIQTATAVGTPPVATTTILYPAFVSSYTLVDLDLRYKIAESPTGGDVAIQLNITNLFDELYVGGFGGSPDRYTSPFVQIGPPRAASISLLFGY